MQKLSGKNLLLVGFTLFSMFFGAGNLIFPPHLGAQAGVNFWPAFTGLFVSAVGLPIAGVVAVARAGVAHGRCAACSGAAAGQSHAGGKLYHSGAGVGAGGIAFGAHQLFNGAARAVRCGAHRHPERRPTAVGDDEGVSPSAGPTAAGGVAACGAASLPAGMQRGPWHLLEERRCR